MLSNISCVCWPPVYLLGTNICLGLLPIFDRVIFFFFLLSWMSCLYILEINPLSVASFVIISSHSEGCLFNLFIVSFAVHQLLDLIRSHLFTFDFISITLGGESKSILLQFMSQSVLPMLSSKSFIVTGLPFKYLIHFEFIFVYVLGSVLVSFFYT